MRIHSWNKVRPAHIARGAATRRVDDCYETRRQWICSIDSAGNLRYKSVGKGGGCSAGAAGNDTTGGVATLDNYVGSNDADLERQSGTGVDDGPNFPVAENGITDPTKIVLLTLAEWQIVKRTQIESVTQVKVVVSLVVVKFIERAGIVCGRSSLVRAGRISKRT